MRRTDDTFVTATRIALSTDTNTGAAGWLARYDHLG
jgi:hypothetical protein